MKQIKIKNIPDDEPYLFATVASLHYRAGLLRVPRYEAVKFILTNKNLYLKVHGYLIDTTGPVKMPLDSVCKLIIERPAIKAFKTNYLSFVDQEGNKTKFTVTCEECNKIIDILKNVNPTIQVEKGTT